MKKLKIILNQSEESEQSDVATQNKEKLKTPDLYKVILMNDDFTPMDFVIEILSKVFHHDSKKSTEIMLDVHEKGAGVAGVFTYGVAETKTYVVNNQARKNNFPLKAIIEKE